MVVRVAFRGGPVCFFGINTQIIRSIQEGLPVIWLEVTGVSWVYAHKYRYFSLYFTSYSPLFSKKCLVSVTVLYRGMYILLGYYGNHRRKWYLYTIDLMCIGCVSSCIKSVFQFLYGSVDPCPSRCSTPQSPGHSCLTGFVFPSFGFLFRLSMSSEPS